MELKSTIIDSNQNLVVVTIKGKIKSGYLSELENEVQKLSRERPLRAILDLTGVEAIDSSGIGQLIKARTDVIQKGGNVVLMVSGRVQMVIKLSGLENYFPVGATQEEAIHLVNQPPEPKAPETTPEATEEAQPDAEPPSE